MNRRIDIRRLAFWVVLLFILMLLAFFQVTHAGFPHILTKVALSDSTLAIDWLDIANRPSGLDDGDNVGSPYWTLGDGATCDTLWWAMGSDTLYIEICAAGTRMWTSNDFTVGKNGLFSVDSMTAGKLTVSNILKIPTSASPAPATEGEVGWDSDDDKLVIYDGTNVITAAGKKKSRSFVKENITATADFGFWQTPRTIVLTKVSAYCKDGVNVVGQLEELDGGGANPASTMSSDLTVTTTEIESSTFSNATIDAGDWIGWKTTSVSGTVTFFSITFEYYEQ